jgi:TatD DNase family protein
VTNEQLFSIGLHPLTFDQYDATEKTNYFNLISHSNCKAIGEIGLDNRNTLNSIDQQLIFIEQLKLANTFHKPILLHCIGQWDLCKKLHQLHAPTSPLIYHGFAKASIYQKVLDYPSSIFSIGAAVLTNSELQETVKTIPIERLLLETDDATIEIIEVYTKVASLKSLSLQTLSSEIAANAKRIFHL